MNKRTKLMLKYFWQQKVYEVVGISLGIYLIPKIVYFIGSIVCELSGANWCSSNGDIYFLGTMTSFILAIIIGANIQIAHDRVEKKLGKARK